MNTESLQSIVCQMKKKNDLTKTESHSLGVSIFVDETHMRYKDIYTYLNELSEIFEDITAG